VVLGVAFLTGTLVLGSTLRANFDDLFTEVNAGTDVVVRNSTDLGMDSPRGLIDASLADEVADVDGVAAAEPVVTGMGQLLGADGEAVGGNGPPQLAGSWTTNPDLNPYRLAEGRAPEGDDEVVVNRGALEAGDLALGDTATVLTPEPVEATIVGVSTFGDEDGLGGVTFTAFSLDDAMTHVAKSTDGVSSIAVQAADGTSQDELAARVGEMLPSELEAVTGSEVTTEATDEIAETFLDMMLMFLTMFAGIALLVATFSIYNTFSIIVAQRTRQAALLRAIGARRGQVLRSVVFEALIVGLVASVVGLLGGIGMAGLLKGMFDAMGFALPAGGTVIETGTIVAGLVVGVLVTLVAGVFPAVKASRVAPLAAIREVAVERTSPSLARIVAGTAIAVIGVGLTLVAALGDEDMLAVVGIGAVLTVVGAVVLGPVVARPASSLLGAPIARLRGLPGGLARQNAMRNPRRTAGTASALMVGVAVVTLFTVFASSLRASLDDTIDRSFGGDLVINNGVFGGGGISPDMADEVEALDEVDLAVGVGQGAAEVDGSTKQLSIADPAELSQLLDLGVSDGSLDDVDEGSLAVSDASAESNGWQVGDVVPLTFSDGRTEDLTIRATYETDDLAGGYLVPRTVWASHAVQDIDQMVFVSASDGTSVADAKAAVTEVADRFGGPNVEDRDEFSSTMTTGVDLMLGVVYALLALAIFIALMGIANTLSLAIHERTREIGLLRAVGQTRRQVRSTVRWESVVIATFGAVGGIALGVFLGWAMVQAVATASGGLGTFALPVGNLAIVLVVGAIAGVLAGLRPARRAARLDVLAAIATE
ncbi:MAG TPA: FtsX-like permease family protein, partial [Acidimicrobiales bacterium]|nr:FtsX-like permease family protein [Acidimicrobiales bacterium]